MEILERFDDGTFIALIRAEELHNHEHIKEEYLKELTAEIKKDKELLYPVIIDRYSYVVLDGHHRYRALQRLGCKFIPTYVVDYYNPKILVRTWHPLIKTQEEVDAILGLFKKNKFSTQKVENEQVAHVLVESKQACLGYIIRKNNKNIFYIVKSPEGQPKDNGKDPMLLIQKELKSKGLRKELDYVGDHAEIEKVLKKGKAKMVIIIPEVTKGKIVEQGSSGNPFPPKTSRHVLPGNKLYPISLSLLKKKVFNETA